MCFPDSSSSRPRGATASKVSDVAFTEMAAVAALMAFLVVVLVVLVLAYVIQRLLKCSRSQEGRVVTDPSSRRARGRGGQGRPPELLEVHSRRISLVTPLAAFHEAIRCRTPPPRYSEVGGSLPSYTSAFKDLSGSLGGGVRVVQGLAAADDSVFLSPGTISPPPPPPPPPPPSPPQGPHRHRL
ncbi:formin-like protein 15 isoform X2 [Portunus trituberculatus]|uniref:formin-like protein 15 isoform X2 n=1 Tax=Portunus trituberculatus TaxID=210409 RepID=UPI001E1CF833|nr:formin-like protein 15 isoform X2 [Portunus trituberculatus]